MEYRTLGKTGLNISVVGSMENHDSAENLFSDYGLLVTSICRRMIQDEETAKDAAQEVWLEILKSLPSFKGLSKISTWIYTITYRVVLKFAKNERQYTTKFLAAYFHGPQLEAPEAAEPEKQFWIKEMCDKCLTGVLHCLDNDTRIAFIFRDISGLSYQEIAAVLEKDETTVRQMISRSRRKLKNFLNNECLLHNPDGNCKCRMKNLVLQIDLPEEYRKLRRTVHHINLYRESEQVLPKKNYWEKII